ncbi:hypothetical protein [Flagellimonas sp. GZD32]|uniref:hypothetical protein n=1 Tax=Flagellimonas cixiensis TaxID=3228750 RepID=UPI0035C889A0
MLILVSSCGGGGEGEQPLPEPEPEPINNLPAKVIGTLPANGEPCSDYTEVSTDATKVVISFDWQTAEYTDNYELVITESSSEVFKDTYTDTNTQVELQRGKTYSWSVKSINEFGETTGDTYSFTTPGTPVGNFAPYAAEISIDFNTESMEASVSWVGSDEDGDALIFEVKVWENENLLIEEVDYTQESLELFAYIQEGSYTIEVVSKDPLGNFSISTMHIQAP